MIRRICVLAMLLIFPTLGLAQGSNISSVDSQASRSSKTTTATDGWQFGFAPYAWVPAISGTTGTSTNNTNVHMSMGDVLSDVNAVVMGVFEARNDRFVIVSDFFWAELSDSVSTPRGVLYDRAKLTLNEYLWTTVAGYSLVRDRTYSLDLLGGFRLISVDSEVKLFGSQEPSGFNVSNRYFDESKTWVDPILALKGRVALSDGIYLRGYGDIGGFDASSKFTWQASVALSYEVANNIAIGGGYRALGYDYDRNNFVYDLIMYGPFFGAEFTF